MNATTAQLTQLSDLSDDPVAEGLEVYLVGGAVRDSLLGRPVRERDWVVLGATPEDMTARGFTPVGKDFPVFLHPKTQEEFALARTERKTARGHQGFQFNTAPGVTLEQDLVRRDFTVNAMAFGDGELHDPFDGQKDLRGRVLMPVSEAFKEDPLRIVRGARFCAQLAGFKPSSTLVSYARDMAAELPALSVERLWAEAVKAQQALDIFFTVLTQLGAIAGLGLTTAPTAGYTPRDNLLLNLAEHAAANSPSTLTWLGTWRAPKAAQTLVSDVCEFQQGPSFEALAQAGGLKKSSPRFDALWAWVQLNHVDASQLNAALGAARAVTAADFPTLSGPELGQALREGQRAAFSQIYPE